MTSSFKNPPRATIVEILHRTVKKNEIEPLISSLTSKFFSVEGVVLHDERENPAIRIERPPPRISVVFLK